MTRDEQKKLKELKKSLLKILKAQIKSYKFKKKDFMIWSKKKDLFFDLLIDVKVTSDNRCICTSTERVKPLWLDDLLWDFLQMESNKSEPLSLRSIGAFTVYGSEIYDDECELENWDVGELEKCVDGFLEHFYNSIQTATIDTYLENIRYTRYHQELREALTYVHNKKYNEAIECLKDDEYGSFKNGDICINKAIKEYCKSKV